MVEAFRNWQVQQGAAVATVNRRLATVKQYAQLAAKVGAIGVEEMMLIKAVAGYGGKEGRRLDEQREVTRRGATKARFVSLKSAAISAGSISTSTGLFSRYAGIS